MLTGFETFHLQVEVDNTALGILLITAQRLVLAMIWD